MQELLTFRQVFVLANQELRRLFNMDPEAVADEGLEPRLKMLCEFFGVEKCAPGRDSWDTYESLADEVGDAWQMEYEDFVVSDLSLYELEAGNL